MDYGLDGRGIGFQFLAEERDLSFFAASRSALGATPAPLHWGLGAPYACVKAAGARKLTTHLHLVSRLRMVELYLNSDICLDEVALN
jgi:hypothetical protein